MRINSSIILLFILFSISVFFVITSEVRGDTIYVDSGESIQDAIDEANNSDTIQINSSTYEENIKINKEIILTGQNKENTIIIGSNPNIDTITVSSSNVEISNLKIKTHPSASSNLAAIYIKNSDYCTVSSCIIEDSKTGIWIKSSNENTIEKNIVKNNDDDGMMITSSSSDNTVYDNIFQNNGLRGIYIDDTSSGNTIYQNSFLSNNPNARDYGSNNWYSGQEGNIWSDYNDYDSDNDGIGDNPYSKNGVVDNYPLGEFLAAKPVAYIDYITSPVYIDQTITFNGHGTPTEDIVEYQWKIDGSIVSSSDEFTYIFSQAKTYTISFRVKDDEQWSDEVTQDLTVNPSDTNDDDEENQKPVAYIDYITPNPAILDETVYFRGYGTDNGEITSYEWKIDGEVVNNSNEFEYAFSQAKTYTISFRIKDDEQWSNSKTESLTIQDPGDNTKPNANAGGPYTGLVDEIISFDGSESFDSDGDTITYSWNFGDNSSSTGKNPQHIYRNKGTYNIILTVTDEHGLSDVDQTIVTIITESNNNQNNQNNEDEDAENDKWVIPGFEIILIFISLMLFILIIRYKKKK